ncbi:unnamed protein product [Amoebophrya sp. A120]|nr:unnamed protein product [Amoebophrya sp. A120]|eukprot:GSA120T00004588001.1
MSKSSSPSKRPPAPPAPPEAPPVNRFTPIPFAPQKNSGQFRGPTHSITTGAVDQEHTTGVFSELAREKIHDEVQAERPPQVSAEVFGTNTVFEKVRQKQDPRLGKLHLPWENPKHYSKADLDGKFPKVLRDRGYENMRTDVPKELIETGDAHNNKKIGKLLEKQFYDKIAKQKKLAELGAPEFGKFVVPGVVDLKMSFDCIDLDKGGQITKDHLRQVLAQCGHAPLDVELENMITMASLGKTSDGEPMVAWEGFEQLFRSPKDIFARVDMSRITEVDAWEVGGGVDLYREAGESADVKDVDVGVEIGVTQKNRELVLKYFCVGAQTILKPSDLKRFYRDFQRVAGASDELPYDLFCKFIERPPSDEVKQLFDFFDADSGGTVSLKEFIIALTNFTNAKPEEKFKFSFMLYDEDGTENIDVEELRALIRANYMVAGYISEAELEEKIENVYISINSDYGMNLNLALFLRCAAKNPLLFAPHPIADDEMEARMKAEERMRGDRDIPRESKEDKDKKKQPKNK